MHALAVGLYIGHVMYRSISIDRIRSFFRLIMNKMCSIVLLPQLCPNVAFGMPKLGPTAGPYPGWGGVGGGGGGRCLYPPPVPEKNIYFVN